MDKLKKKSKRGYWIRPRKGEGKEEVISEGARENSKAEMNGR